MGFQLAANFLLFFYFCHLVRQSDTQLDLPQYQYQAAPQIMSYSGRQGSSYSATGYQSSYLPAASSSGYNAVLGYHPYNNYDNYRAHPRTGSHHNNKGDYGVMEASGSSWTFNVLSVQYCSGNPNQSGPSGSNSKGGQGNWSGKGKSNFRFFTKLGSGVDNVKNGVKNVVKGVKGTKLKIVAKGISGVGSAFNGVAGMFQKMADW